MPASDKLDFNKTDAAGLAAELLHSNWSTNFSLNMITLNVLGEI